MTNALHRTSFIRALRSRLPDVDPWLAGYRDNLTIEMMRVLDFAHDAIRKRDYARVERCFRFLAESFDDGSHALRTSIAVTFLERLDFGNPPDLRAAALLPPQLVSVRVSTGKRVRDVHRGSAKKSRKLGPSN